MHIDDFGRPYVVGDLVYDSFYGIKGVIKTLLPEEKVLLELPNNEEWESDVYDLILESDREYFFG